MAWTKDDLDLNKYSIASGAFGGPIGDPTLIRAVFWDRFAVLCSTGVAVALVRDEKKIVLLGAQSLKPTIQAWLTQRSQRGQFYSAARLLFADFYVGGGPYGFLAVEVRRYTVREKFFARGRVRSVLLCLVQRWADCQDGLDRAREARRGAPTAPARIRPHS